MTLESFSYLATIVIFGGTGAFGFYKREHKLLKKYEWVLLIMLAISLPLVVTESFALKWGAWQYNPDKVLDLHLLGTQIESYLFLPVVCFVLVAATLTYAAREDRTRIKRSSARRRRLSKPRKVLPGSAATKH